jgi:hypothetical protein
MAHANCGSAFARGRTVGQRAVHAPENDHLSEQPARAARDVGGGGSTTNTWDGTFRVLVAANRVTCEGRVAFA